MTLPRDIEMLDHAFVLAEHGRGRTCPNPFVGCVIADADGTMVGEGWTQPAGGSHAEVVALAMAGDRARGGTAWVTLEPCNHHGRTPPCSQALLDAGIARLVYALSDPNPVAIGGGTMLAEAGVEVVPDAAVDRARQQHEIFLHGIATGRPFVILKTATSLDGRIADHTGTSQWITGPATRARGHELRREVDAVLVGSATALADDPSLTVRLPGWDGPQPRRVVLDRRGRTEGADLKLFTDGLAPTTVLDSPDPGAALATLWELGVHSVLVEGGAGVAGAFVAAGLVDRYVLHLGNVLLGEGLGALSTRVALPDAPRLRLVSAELSGDDVVLTAYPRTP